VDSTRGIQWLDDSSDVGSTEMVEATSSFYWWDRVEAKCSSDDSRTYGCHFPAFWRHCHGILPLHHSSCHGELLRNTAWSVVTRWRYDWMSMFSLEASCWENPPCGACGVVLRSSCGDGILSTDLEQADGL
jgi:hypothetical protein